MTEFPSLIADAVADPITGLTAAATVLQLLGQGGRWLVDVALSRIAASMNDHDRRVVPSITDPDPPSVRRQRGSALPLGRDTTSVFRELLQI